MKIRTEYRTISIIVKCTRSKGNIKVYFTNGYIIYHIFFYILY